MNLFVIDDRYAMQEFRKHQKVVGVLALATATALYIQMVRIRALEKDIQKLKKEVADNDA